MARHHDAQFDAGARKGFFAHLRRYGYTYDGLARALEGLDLPRPSAGSASYRTLILDTVRALPYAEVWEIADRVALLYRPQHHLGAPLAPIEDGYLAALCDDSPALCAAGAVPAHTTHCEGARVGGFACMRAVIPAPSCCDELEAA
jgi:hypothetical protein